MQLKLIYEQSGPELQAENKQTNKRFTESWILLLSLLICFLDRTNNFALKMHLKKKNELITA